VSRNNVCALRLDQSNAPLKARAICTPITSPKTRVKASSMSGS
jgi:hypothetical protein